MGGILELSEFSDILITAISRESSYLCQIKELWRPHSDTLGYFPDGAFNESAEKGHIFIAIESLSRKCIGYLLFRISGEKIIIVHLCVDPQWRGKSVAKKLVAYLIQNTKKFRGIGLYCRRDFAVSKIWPSLGFIAQNEKLGRGKKRTELTYWWFDHGHPNLFSNIEGERESKINAVIDANVFFDLFSEDPYKDESKALLADWLRASLELFLTDETFNEINRSTIEKERSHQRNLAKNFPFANFGISYDETFENLKILFPNHHLSESGLSDLRQLAKTIASGTQFFITRDEELLNM